MIHYDIDILYRNMICLACYVLPNSIDPPILCVDHNHHETDRRRDRMRDRRRQNHGTINDNCKLKIRLGLHLILFDR